MESDLNRKSKFYDTFLICLLINITKLLQIHILDLLHLQASSYNTLYFKCMIHYIILHVMAFQTLNVLLKYVHIPFIGTLLDLYCFSCDVFFMQLLM